MSFKHRIINLGLSHAVDLCIKCIQAGETFFKTLFPYSSKPYLCVSHEKDIPIGSLFTNKICEIASCEGIDTLEPTEIVDGDGFYLIPIVTVISFGALGSLASLKYLKNRQNQANRRG